MTKEHLFLGNYEWIYQCTHCGNLAQGHLMVHVWDGSKMVVVHIKCVDAFAESLKDD